MNPNCARSVVLAAVLLLGACSTVRMREDSATPPATKAPTVYATQLAVGRCAFGTSAEAGGIAAAFLSGAISEGVNRIGEALKEAAARKEVTATATRNLQVSAESMGPCVQVVRGWFYIDPTLDPATKGTLEQDAKFTAARAWFDDNFITAARFTTLWKNNGLWLAGPPDFLYEGRFVSFKGTDTVTIAPQYVRFNEPLFTRPLRPGRSRHVAVFLAFHQPGASADAKEHPAATFVLGNLNPGDSRTYPADDTALTRFDAEGLPAGPLNRWPFESDWFTLSLQKTEQPLTISGAVTETQEASQFLGFIAAVFGNSKEAINEALLTRVDPAKRAAARVSEASADSTIEEKIDAAEGALIACKDAALPNSQHATSARKALRDINAAAVAGNRPTPVDTVCIDSIQQTQKAEEMTKACAAALAKITTSRTCKGA